MNRRRYLGSAANVLGIAAAGCLERGGPADDSTRRGDEPTTDDNETTAEGTTFSGVEIGDVTVTPELVAMNSPDSIGTFGGRDEQYVMATVSSRGSNIPEYGALELDAGGTAYAADEDAGGTNGYLWEFESPYRSRYGDDGATRGWAVFPVPKPLDTETAAITWPGGERPLDSDAVDYLARPPTEFEIREFAAPDSVDVGEEATVSVTVENAGDVDGTFVGALNRVGPWVAYAPQAAISLDVPTGDTATWEYSHTPDERHVDHDDESLTMRFNLDWRGERVTREITVETE
jgi:hypothetical protein